MLYYFNWTKSFIWKRKRLRHLFENVIYLRTSFIWERQLFENEVILKTKNHFKTKCCFIKDVTVI